MGVGLYIDPPSASLGQDRFFGSSEGSHHSSLARCLTYVKSTFESQNVSVHTVDMLPQTASDDLCVVVSIGNHDTYPTLRHRRDVRLSAFLVVESPVVEPRIYRGLRQAKRHFKHIYSCIDGPSAAEFIGEPVDMRPLRWPIDFESVDEPLWSRSDRDFLVMINMNKIPRINNYELFRERMRAVEYFSRTKEIDLYGVGWNAASMKMGRTWLPWTIRRVGIRVNNLVDKVRPDPLLVAARTVYKGQLNTKWETLSRYTFSLCFENAQVKGWLTEKLFECLRVGTIPVYWGATDIEQLIPPECFVDMRQFSGYDDLRRFLRGLPPARISDYRQAGREFLASDRIEPFSKRRFATILAELIQQESGKQIRL